MGSYLVDVARNTWKTHGKPMEYSNDALMLDLSHSHRWEYYLTLCDYLFMVFGKYHE